PGNDALPLEYFRERSAIAGLLPDRLIEQNRSAYEIAQVGSSKKHLAISAAVVCGRGQLDALESFGNRGRALVRRQNSFARRHQRLRDRLQIICAHKLNSSPPTTR